MSFYCHATFEARTGLGEDRVRVCDRPHSIVALVVDGAGGVGRGAIAAEAVCRALDDYHEHDWASWLTHVDHELVKVGGMAAAVVAEIFSNGRVEGAVVGDCEAWIASTQLTSGRKPLLGSGDAAPQTFSAAFDDTLVTATDGLWKYASKSKIHEALLSNDPAVAVANAARLPNGKLQDDIGVFIYRK